MRRLAAAVFALPMLACGGRATAAGQPLDPGTPAATLSSDEAAQFCDAIAALYGGYGKSVTCHGTENVGPTDQASCVSDYLKAQPRLAACPATVGDVESCLGWQLMAMCSSNAGPRPDACSVVAMGSCSWN